LDPNCPKFKYLKEPIIFTGIKMRFKKQRLLTDYSFERLLKEALAQVKRLSKEVSVGEGVAKEVAAKESVAKTAVVGATIAEEAAQDDGWEDV
jgi:hypothetical protein